MSTAMQRKSEERDIAGVIAEYLTRSGFTVYHEVPHPTEKRKSLDMLAVAGEIPETRHTIAVEIKTAPSFPLYEQADRWRQWASFVAVGFACDGLPRNACVWMRDGRGIGAWGVGGNQVRASIDSAGTNAAQGKVEQLALLAIARGSRGWIAPAGTSAPRRMHSADQLAELAKSEMLRRGLTQAALSDLLPDVTHEQRAGAAKVMGSRRGRALNVTCRKFKREWMIYAKG